ncbi:hypothetical protein SM2011_a6258 (plasmid) [Sinorhizobium meliloti 2011]|nr:hypothetical protein SM2011_a6258 [Sinorhizobium meliloti 2011]
MTVRRFALLLAAEDLPHQVPSAEALGRKPAQAADPAHLFGSQTGKSPFPQTVMWAATS